MDIGQAIKILRVQNDMTQAQLAERCGMTVAGIWYLETGKRFPPKGTVEKLCNVFGLPTSYLLMASIEESDLPEEKRVLFRTMLEPLRNELLSKPKDCE